MEGAKGEGVDPVFVSQFNLVKYNVASNLCRFAYAALAIDKIVLSKTHWAVSIVYQSKQEAHQLVGQKTLRH